MPTTATSTSPDPHAGLRDIVIGSTRLSSIDGEAGRLIYCGYDIHELAKRSTFEEVAYLLFFRALPSEANLAAFRTRLAARRPLGDALLAVLRALPRDAAPIDVLRTMVSAAGTLDPASKDHSPDATLEKAIRLTALVPTILAAHHRLARGEEPIAPRPDVGTAAAFLHMLDGRDADPLAARVLDVALILHADHGMNASTFAALVTAATLSDLYSAVTSAIGALKGPLHGGANEGVIQNLLEIGDPALVEAWVAAKVARREKIMGFGHAVYTTYDPRATELRAIALEAGARAGTSKWVEMTQRMERAVWDQKRLYPNVDLYSAPVYHTLGIPTTYFTPVFAMSRVVGWCAHVMEQYADNKLIRPRDNYVGATGAVYLPIAERTADIPA